MRPALLLLLAAGSAGTAFGWGCEGHQMVALIARENLTKSAAAAVDKLLADNPTSQSLNPYCKDVPPDPMAVASTWADDVRRNEKNGTWHYIDIPLWVKATSGPIDKWCEPVTDPRPDGTRPGCVTSALDYELGVLRDAKQTGTARTNALRYVIHFVGDMHQPLHDSDNEDSGGNCTGMKFFDEPNSWNLHAVWDFKLIQRDLAARKATQQSYAKQLQDQYGAKFRKDGVDTKDPVKWAWEGHELAVKVTYGAMKPAIAIEPEGAKVGCEVEKNKVTKQEIVLGQEYFDASIGPVREALAKAGYRLAALLNATF